MQRPKNENLRLIGAPQEALHILENFRVNRNKLVAAAVLLTTAAAILAGDAQFGAHDEFQATPGYLVLARIGLALGGLGCLVYGVRTLRYSHYAGQLTAFLRRHNRL